MTRAIVRTRIATLALLGVSSSLLGVIGCRPAHRKPQGLDSPWTTYNPSADPKTFIAQIKFLSFVEPDSLQDSEPLNADKKHVYVDIRPEESVANRFDPTNPGQPAFNDPTFLTDSGRVLALFRLRDVDNDFAPLGLDRRSKHSVYAVWWVETRGDTDWHHWTSHYYRINPDSSTVIAMDATMGPDFWFFDDHYAAGATPRLADWNKHPDPFIPVALAPVPLSGPRKIGNSSWVSCGAGCCNGQ